MYTAAKMGHVLLDLRIERGALRIAVGVRLGLGEAAVDDGIGVFEVASARLGIWVEGIGDPYALERLTRAFQSRVSNRTRSY